jgi:hypothetical protein
MTVISDLFADLHNEYVNRTPARKALLHFKRLKVRDGSRFRLKHLLRHHDEEEITNRETYLRDQYDYLLSFYGLVEIASALGLIKAFPRSFSIGASTVLADPYVRRYYEENYPLLLPELFRFRLENRPLQIESNIPDVDNVFERFRQIGAQVDLEDEETDKFLWLLDGGVVGQSERSISDLVRVISKPSTFLKKLTAGAEADDPDPIGQALIGLSNFLDLCDELHRFLKSFEDYPLFQSLCWHHHAYWFDHLRAEIGAYLQQILSGFMGWQTRAARSENFDSDVYLGITELMSGRYGWRLYESVHSMRINRAGDENPVTK